MPINRREPPEGLDAAVRSTADLLLPSRLPSGDQGLVGGGPEMDTVAVSDTLPLYHLGLDSIVDGTGLAGAQENGWRSVVQAAGSAVAVADVGGPSGVSDTEVRQMSYGPAVGGLVDAASTAQDAVGEGDFDERLLQIPGISLTAVWLHDADESTPDLLVPGAPTSTGVEADRRYLASELLDMLRPLAAERLSNDGRAPRDA